MNSISLNIHSKRTSDIVNFIPYLIGNVVELPNGCTLYLTPFSLQEGYYPCSNPYGVDSYFQSIEGIKDWLDYWDAPRTETGYLIE